MQKFRTCFLILGVLLFCAVAFGQSNALQNPNPVYVSGGPFIYNVVNGSLTQVYGAGITPGVAAPNGNLYTGANHPNYSSLAIGPDNVDLGNNNNAAHPFLIYACDSNNDTIVRFDPASPSDAEMVYQNTVPGLTPACGRFSSTGDFYVTNQSVSGTGANVYKFTGIANVSLGHLTSLQMTPAAVTLGLPSGFTGAGITQKNVGDLLLVDTAGNEVLRAPYGPPFGTATSYLTGLSSPLGIARTSTGDVFVANSGSSPSTVAHFTSNGNPAATCSSLTLPAGAGNTSLFFLAASETDVIYAAASQPTSSADYTEDLDFVPEGDNPGEVWSWSPGQASPNTCVLQKVALSETQLSGVAVAPIPTAAISETVTATAASPTPTTFSYNSNEFQLIATGCTATVTAYPLSLANIDAMINLAKTGGLPNGGTPIVNLGEGGYEIAYVVQWNGCTPVLSDGLIGDFIFGLYDDNLSGNPQIIQCDSTPADSPNEPLLDGTNACKALTLIGSYPLGGPIPNDLGAGGGGHTNSVFFLANANPSPNAEQGQFCGFIPPNGTTFDTDDFVVVAFRLAQNGGNCTRGPFIPNAQVLLSVAETAPSFSPIVNLKTLGNLGATFPEPGLCKFFPNSPLACTYVLVFNLQANGLTPGTYSLSAEPVTGNAATEAVTITVVTESPNKPF
jgi:hypothetical protein